MERVQLDSNGISRLSATDSVCGNEIDVKLYWQHQFGKSDIHLCRIVELKSGGRLDLQDD